MGERLHSSTLGKTLCGEAAGRTQGRKCSSDHSTELCSSFPPLLAVCPPSSTQDPVLLQQASTLFSPPSSPQLSCAFGTAGLVFCLAPLHPSVMVLTALLLCLLSFLCAPTPSLLQLSPEAAPPPTRPFLLTPYILPYPVCFSHPSVLLFLQISALHLPPEMFVILLSLVAED